MAFPNRYKGTCSCGAKVPEGRGFVTGPPWVTHCRACWEGAEEAPLPAVFIGKLLGDEVTVAPDGFLEGDAFNRYRNACRSVPGSRYDSTERAQRIPAGEIQGAIKALEKAGFSVTVEPSAKAALALRAKSAATLAVDVDARIGALETRSGAKLRLFPFQRQGVAWLISRHSALLADEMGLGKTAQALMALPDQAPVVIVAPVVAKGVWQNEIRRWRPDLSPAILSGRGSFRWPSPGEVVITNYDILPDAPPPGCPSGVVIISDEAHALKNRKALRTKRFEKISHDARRAGGRVWLLTATPLLNRPPELWQVLESAGLATEAFGNFGRFCRLFDYRKEEYGGTWGKPQEGAKEAIQKVTLRRHRIDVLPDLPAKRRTEVQTDLDAKTIRLLDRIMAELAKTGVDLDQALAKLGGGLTFERLSGARAALATAKIPAMLSLVEEYEDSGEPLVVFSAHRAPIDTLAGREGWGVITGDTKPEERTKIQEAFQAGHLKGVAATIQAGGVAITLTHASHALFVDLDWTPALNSQAEDRICRIGQTRGVLIKRLVADHDLDRRVLALLDEKQGLIEASVEAAAVVEATLSGAGAEALQEAAQALEALESREARRAPAKAGLAPAKAGLAPARARLAPANGQVATPAPSNSRRPPLSRAEKWAARAIVQLDNDNADGAAFKNEVGFNRFDTAFGGELAAAIASGEGLTPKQWEAAIALASKYRRQVGYAPSEPRPNPSENPENPTKSPSFSEGQGTS